MGNPNWNQHQALLSSGSIAQEYSCEIQHFEFKTVIANYQSLNIYQTHINIFN